MVYKKVIFIRNFKLVVGLGGLGLIFCVVVWDGVVIWLVDSYVNFYIF